MRVIRRFDVLSVMKLAGVIYGVIGIVAGVFFALAAALGVFAAQRQAGDPFSGPAGILFIVAFAAAIAVRRRGFRSGAPPDLAAMVISLISRVNILPRLASSAPFLCLIVAHLECPDIRNASLRRMAGADRPGRALAVAV